MPRRLVYDRGMARILKAVIVVVILYLAVTKGWPWLKSQLGESSDFSTENSYQAVCYAAASRAADELSERLRSFSTPPIDSEAWEDTVSASRYRIEKADKECRTCDHEACLEASRAVAGLDSMVKWLDESVQAGRGIPPDGANRLDRVYDALNRAKSHL